MSKSWKDRKPNVQKGGQLLPGAGRGAGAHKTAKDYDRKKDKQELRKLSFREWMNICEVRPETHLKDWSEKNLPLLEIATTTRYSIEVNFRSKIKEALEAFAKIVLGYVSAAMKQNGFHVKLVFEQSPLRILVSSRNWDDGEWILIISFNPEHGGSFIISKGFYNRDRKSISVQQSDKCSGDSAAEIAGQARNAMHLLQHSADRHLEKLNPVPLKRGPR